MKSISRILILVLACMMLLTSCGTDNKNAENKATATAVSTDAPTATATIEPTTEATKTPVTDSSENPTTTEESTITTKPTKSPSIIVQPTEKPTEKPTVKPTNKPTETVKPTPTLDPSGDYSQWGKHGFETLLPAPLPFSEITNWLSKKDAYNTYEIKNDSKIYDENLVKIVEEYVKSFESYGYTVLCESYSFRAYKMPEKMITFTCAPGYMYITIICA